MNAEEVITGMLRDGYSVRFVASGDSMYPSIRSGETLEVEPVAASGLRPGDVVLIRAERGLTAHRIVRIDGVMVVTRGDNCLRRDRPLPFAAVLGRVASPPAQRLSGLRSMMLYCRVFARRVAGVLTR